MTDLLDDESLLDLRRRAKPTDPAAVLAEERARRKAVARPPTRATESTESWENGTGSPDSVDSVARSGAMCGVCKTRPARDRCTSCGQPACAADLWVMLRLCRSCASDGDVARGQRGAKPEGRNWLEGAP